MPVDPDRLVAAVSAAIETATAPLLARIAILEQRQLPVPRDGLPGRDGGIGPPGLAPDPAVIEALVAATVTRAVQALPIPKDGQDGSPGRDGTTLTLADVQPLIAAEVSARVAALPIPKDVVSVLGAVIDRDGHLILTLSDGQTKDIGGVVGRDVDMSIVERFLREEVAKIQPPKDGVDGRDGLGFEDVIFEEDARGRSYAKFVRGDVVKAARITSVTDQGVWRDGTAYLKWDGVTWGGSFWIAQKDTTTKPGDGSSEWRLAVKKGGDGKEGKSGQDGKDGRPGRDLTVAGKPW